MSWETPESESHSLVFDSLEPRVLYSPWNSPGQNTGVGSLSLLQNIFPPQGSNTGLPYCRRILYQLSHKGSKELDTTKWLNWTELAWIVPLVSLIFLKSSLVFPILLFSSISLHWSLRKPFLSLLAILWNSAFKWVYLSFSPLLFTSVLFTAICKAFSDSHLAFLHFFFLGMVLIPVSCTMSQTSVYSSSGSLCIRACLISAYLTCF